MAPCIQRNCGRLAQERFGGFCCYKCSRSDDTLPDTEHGDWCAGTSDNIMPPGPSTFQLRYQIKETEKKIMELQSEVSKMKWCMVSAVAMQAAVLLVLYRRKA